MRPHFGNIKRVNVVILRLCFGHDLHLHRPAREVTFIDAFHQILLRTEGGLSGRFFVGQSLNALVGFKVPFNPVTFAVIVPEAQCV